MSKLVHIHVFILSPKSEKVEIKPNTWQNRVNNNKTKLFARFCSYLQQNCSYTLCIYKPSIGRIYYNFVYRTVPAKPSQTGAKVIEFSWMYGRDHTLAHVAEPGQKKFLAENSEILFFHIISVLFRFLLLKKRLALAWTGSKIGLNEKWGKFKET